MVKNSLRIPLTILVTLAWIALAKAALPVHPSGVDLDDVDLDGVFSCVRRGYSFKVSQQDQRGRTCWDTVTAMSCWGRCDSNEVTTRFFSSALSFARKSGYIRKTRQAKVLLRVSGLVHRRLVHIKWNHSIVGTCGLH